MIRDQEIAALRSALEPFLRLDHDIGDEWADVCVPARRVYEQTGRQPITGEGQVCPQCGGGMQRTGSCLTCTSCGFNDGCG
jgi:hypothetical protein